MTAVARQHELDPKMVLRWSTELKRKDLNQLEGESNGFLLSRNLTRMSVI